MGRAASLWISAGLLREPSKECIMKALGDGANDSTLEPTLTLVLDINGKWTSEAAPRPRNRGKF